jgi:tetratricopeptide (TPR) repeat protein
MSNIKSSSVRAPHGIIAALAIVALGGAPLTACEPKSNIGPLVGEALKEASRIALLQDEHQDYWRDDTLLLIGNVQMRAGDFDAARGAMRKSSDDYPRNAAFVHLAKAVAASGDRAKAFDLVRELGTEHGWSQRLIEDGVQLRWIEQLISLNDLARAETAIGDLADARSRSRALSKLAIGYFKSGDKSRGDQTLGLAKEASGGIREEFDRAEALWQIADVEIDFKESESARSTIHDVGEASLQFADNWARVCGLREAAVRAVRNSDRQTAADLFAKAIASANSLDASNYIGALNLIAMAQASAGLTGDALKTAQMIEHSEKDFTRDGRREEALCRIAVAHAKAGDFATALSTAQSIRYYMQYQNDALAEIARLQLGMGAIDAALATTKLMENRSRRAASILRIATVCASQGYPKRAKEIAMEIELKPADDFPIARPETFDFRKAETWAIEYDRERFSTSLRISIWTAHAAEVAAAAMTLAQTLKEPGAADYAHAFRDVSDEFVVQAVARAHAAHGDANKAYAWARQIGSDEQIPSDSSMRFAVQLRIHALVGVAEGVLDKSGVPEPPE